MSIISLDLGGTAIKGGLFVNGMMTKSSKQPTNAKEGKEAIFNGLLSLYRTLDDGKVEALGLSSAGDIDPEKGICVYATSNLPGWTGFPIAQRLKEATHVPVYVDNDAICALIGEAHFHPEVEDLTMLTFGTGVGGASLIKGRIDRRDFCRWGHYPLVKEGRLCNCGKRGCAEAYLSGSVFSKMAAAAGYRSSIEAEKAALQGQAQAVGIVKEYVSYLNLFLRDIVAAVHPELILLGGGLMNGYDALAPYFLPCGARVEKAALGNNAGIYGAYYLTKERGKKI